MIDKREFASYKEPQSNKATLAKLESKDKKKEDKYEQAKIGVIGMDAKTINQQSSSGESARDRRK